MFEQHQTQGGNGGGDRDSGGDVVAAALHVTGSHMLRAAREKAAMLCVMQLCIPCMPSSYGKIHSSTLHVT